MNMPRLLSAVTGGDFFFVGGEGSQYFLLLRFRNLEVGQGPSEFRCHLIEFLRRNLQIAVGFFQTECGLAGLGGVEFEGTA